MSDDQQDARDAAEATTRNLAPVPEEDAQGKETGKAQEDLDADDLKGFVKDPLEQ
jgi:hypothetical protein